MYNIGSQKKASEKNFPKEGLFAPERGKFFSPAFFVRYFIKLRASFTICSIRATSSSDFPCFSVLKIS